MALDQLLYVPELVFHRREYVQPFARLDQVNYERRFLGLEPGGQLSEHGPIGQLVLAARGLVDYQNGFPALILDLDHFSEDERFIFELVFIGILFLLGPFSGLPLHPCTRITRGYFFYCLLEFFSFDR